jgi:hypothetical protein
LSSFENNDDLINTSNTKLITKKHSQKPSRNIENNKTEKRNRRRGVCEACPPCSTCCCLASLFGSLLLLVGLIILAVYLLPNDQISTTMITTTSTSEFYISQMLPTLSITFQVILRQRLRQALVVSFC